MPAPEPSIRASMITSPWGVTCQSSDHCVFSTEWVQVRVKAAVANRTCLAPMTRQRFMIASSGHRPTDPSAVSPVMLRDKQRREQEADLVHQRNSDDEAECGERRQGAFPECEPGLQESGGSGTPEAD